jgi:hypothetical protein
VPAFLNWHAAQPCIPCETPRDCDAEEAIRAWFVGQPLSASFADFGGSLPALVTYAAIFFVALIPFFAFQEAARILGGGALRNLFFRGGGERFRLIED